MTKRVSILCFGNSLTAGYYQFGLDYHPYAWKLESRLKAAFPSHTFLVNAEGLPGDLAIGPPGRFLPRIQEKCGERHYDWVIVLGGTNDLGYGYAPERIYPALQDAWNVALTGGSKVLALTIPECAAKNAALDSKRADLNARILAHEAERFHAFDLHAKIPYHASSEEFKEKMWDDGLHLTPHGYDLVGNEVADHLIELIQSSGGLEA
ncbi:SGNH hydrolase [Aspergillus campestris IBT 28561]|uniref:SGNH hydrolase n=1 Tax=Aspergillus campestris (strain IBT 28561) TaxID=1392248 RepID=A0A2I1D5M1_ASPC2|nr:SGNH hydrolase [Aspergillus campestris IBT 28561]PKY05169.1 SGNH hydrolase [Aspergillus campestris IBT 28561]